MLLTNGGVSGKVTCQAIQGWRTRGLSWTPPLLHKELFCGKVFNLVQSQGKRNPRASFQFKEPQHLPCGPGGLKPSTTRSSPPFDKNISNEKYINLFDGYGCRPTPFRGLCESPTKESWEKGLRTTLLIFSSRLIWKWMITDETRGPIRQWQKLVAAHASIAGRGWYTGWLNLLIHNGLNLLGLITGVKPKETLFWSVDFQLLPQYPKQVAHLDYKNLYFTTSRSVELKMPKSGQLK